MRRELTRQVQDQQQIMLASRWMIDMAAKGIARGAVEIVLRRPKRNQDQNAKYHPMIGDIHAQAFPQYSFKAVKAVLVSQFADEKQAMGDPLRHPGEIAWDWKLKREVYIRPSTTDFTKSEASEFIEWLYAQGADLDVTWSEKAREAINAERGRA